MKQWFLLLSLTVVVFYPSLLHPFVDIDEVIWGEFANAVASGCPPYVCVLGEKPPLLYLFYAGIFSLFGANNYLAVHLLHILWVSLAALLLSRLSFLAGIFYILLLGLPGFTTIAATGESLMNPFLILSWILFLQLLEKPSFWKAAVVGALIGVATLFRLQAGIQLLVYLAVWVARGKLLDRAVKRAQTKVFRSDRTQTSVTVILGLAVVWFVAFLILSAWGSWEAYKFWGLQYSLGYLKSGFFGAGVWKSSLRYLALVFGSTIVFWLLAGNSLRRSDEGPQPHRLRQTAWIYLLGALVAASAGFRYYPHYFIQAFPPLAILAALGFRALQGRGRRMAMAGLVLSFLVILIQHFFFDAERALDSSRDYEPFNQRVGAYIREKTNPGDKITVWGWGNGIYYYADRRVATRFVHSDFLTGRISSADPKLYRASEASRGIMPGVWEMFFEDLRKNKPVYFIDTSPAGIHEYQHFPPSHYPLLKDFLDRDYRLEAEIEGIRLYRRSP